MCDIFSGKKYNYSNICRHSSPGRCPQPGALERCHVNVIYSGMIEGEKGKSSY